MSNWMSSRGEHLIEHDDRPEPAVTDSPATDKLSGCLVK